VVFTRERPDPDIGCRGLQNRGALSQLQTDRNRLKQSKTDQKSGASAFARGFRLRSEASTFTWFRRDKQVLAVYGYPRVVVGRFVPLRKGVQGPEVPSPKFADASAVVPPTGLWRDKGTIFDNLKLGEGLGAPDEGLKF
jgi:hypothetical protein